MASVVIIITAGLIYVAHKEHKKAKLGRLEASADPAHICDDSCIQYHSSQGLDTASNWDTETLASSKRDKFRQSFRQMVSKKDKKELSPPEYAELDRSKSDAGRPSAHW